MSTELKSKFDISFSLTFREFTNNEIKEDQEDPKEPSHFDYKYIKSMAGPLYKLKNDPEDERGKKHGQGTGEVDAVKNTGWECEVSPYKIQ